MERRRKVPRTKPGRRRAVALQDRDLEVLEFLAAVRYAVPRAVMLAVGLPSLDRARRVLRRLYDNRLLSVTMTASTSPNLLSITREGIEVLKCERPESASRLRPAGPIKLAEVPRHLLLTDLRLWAVELLASRGTPLVRWVSGATADLRYGLAGVAPDALIEFAVPGGTAAIAAEADAARASAPSVLRRIGAYRRAAAVGRLDALWIAAAGDRVRVSAIEARIAELGLSERARVLPSEVLLRRPAALPPRSPTRTPLEEQGGRGDS